jgi:hypothetical protein
LVWPDHLARLGVLVYEVLTMRQTIKITKEQAVRVDDAAAGVSMLWVIGAERTPLRVLPMLSPDQAQALGLALCLAAEKAQAAQDADAAIGNAMAGLFKVVGQA